MTGQDRIDEAASRVLSLEAELEAEGMALTAGDDRAYVVAMLHQWVDTVVAAVASPGVGRVTLIHADGSESRIVSPRLPYSLVRPVSFARPDDPPSA